MNNDPPDCPTCDLAATRPGTCHDCIDSGRSETAERGPPDDEPPPIRNGHLLLKRNDHIVELPFPKQPFSRSTFAATWSPTRLGIGVNGELQSVVTAPTFPPNALVDRARRQSILPTHQYDSPRAFRDVVLNALHGLTDKITTTNMQAAFWDVQHEGKKASGRKPKRETQVHPTIHGLLYDIALAKNLSIYPEAASGSGQLDFLITGTLTNGTTVKACVEFKYAHSADLDQGLTSQLSQYMRSHGSDMGFYCVVWCKGPDFDKPDLQQNLVRSHLLQEQTKIGQDAKTVVIIFVDVSEPDAPSKRG